jgi:hypothetical protein
VRTESIALTHGGTCLANPAASHFASDDHADRQSQDRCASAANSLLAANDASTLHPHFAMGARGRTDMRTSEVAG